MSPPSESRHPSRLIGSEPGLWSSIHSSLELYSLPAHATSLIKIVRAGTGVAGGELLVVSVGVCVRVGVLEGVGVSVGVSVVPGVSGECVAEGVAEGSTVDVVVGVEEADQTVAVGEGVEVLLAVAVSVGASVDCIIEGGEGIHSAHINRIPAQYTGAG